MKLSDVEICMLLSNIPDSENKKAAINEILLLIISITKIYNGSLSATQVQQARNKYKSGSLRLLQGYSLDSLTFSLSLLNKILKSCTDEFEYNEYDSLNPTDLKIGVAQINHFVQRPR